MWRVEQPSLTPSSVASAFHGEFFASDCYVVLRSSIEASGGLLSHEAFFWFGSGSAPDDQAAAQLIAAELDASLGSGVVLRREVQAHESRSFCAVFGNRLEYLPGGGPGAGVHGRPPADRPVRRLLRVKGKRTCRVQSVEAVAVTSLTRASVHILDIGRALYAWSGPEADRRERIWALDVCRALASDRASRGGACACEVVTEGEASDSHARFWQELGGSPSQVGPPEAHPPAGEEGLPTAVSPAATQLWRLSEVLSPSEGKKKLQVTEMLDRPLMRSMLDPACSFILAASDTLWVWIGAEAPSHDRGKAFLYAQSFLQGKGRPRWMPICRVVASAEPSLFTCLFSDWFADAPLPTASAAPQPGGADAARAVARRMTTARMLPPPPASASTSGGGSGGGTGQHTVEVWRIASSGARLEVPPPLLGHFYSEEAYLVELRCAGGGHSPKARVVVYSWAGRECPAAAAEQARAQVSQRDEALRGVATCASICQGCAAARRAAARRAAARRRGPGSSQAQCYMAHATPIHTPRPCTRHAHAHAMPMHTPCTFL